MSIPERLLGAEITSTLSVYQNDDSGNQTLIDADAEPTVELYLREVLDQSLGSATRTGTGTYEITWTATATGLHSLEWTFEVGGEETTITERVCIVSEITGESSSGEEAAASPAVPDAGADRVCRVTHTFFDASGSHMQGVRVEFTPLRTTDSVLSFGTAVESIEAISDENGAVDFYLLRGVTGTLTITGLGIVRTVEVPDVGAIGLFDLAVESADPLEVQTPSFVMLPRRS